MCHRVYDYLQAIEANKATGAKTVDKDLRFKSVKVGGQVVGYSRGDRWQWTEEADKHYTADQQDMAATYATQQ